jgi:hypothetical protein
LLLALLAGCNKGDAKKPEKEKPLELSEPGALCIAVPESGPTRLFSTSPGLTQVGLEDQPCVAEDR